MNTGFTEWVLGIGVSGESIYAWVMGFMSGLWIMRHIYLLFVSFYLETSQHILDQLLLDRFKQPLS